MPKRRPSLILNVQPALVRAAIAAGCEPYHSALAFLAGKVSLTSIPTPVSPTDPNGPFTQLDADGKRARNLAVMFMLTLDPRYAARAAVYLLAWARAHAPVPFKATGNLDYQGGYHQSFGAFCFALAFDLMRSTMTSGDQATVAAYLRTFSDVLETYQMHWAGHMPPAGDTIAYKWPVPGTATYLREDARDYHRGRDTSICTLAAELACAASSRYGARITALYDPANPLNVSAVLHSACNPVNQGDGVLDRVPNCQINAGTTGGSGAGGMNYMTFNTCMAGYVYEMTDQLGRGTDTMRTELRASFDYLARFCSLPLQPLPCAGDVQNWSLTRSRMWVLRHILGGHDDVVLSDQADPSRFWETQYVGSVTTMQAGL